MKLKIVYVQPFNVDDVRCWIACEPQFGEKAVFPESRSLDPDNPDAWSPTMEEIAADGG